MNTFADYILDEKDLAAKMEITYYLSQKTKVFFDKSTVFKTEVTRLFLNYSKIEVDKNKMLTACLLCNCKKPNNTKDIKEIHEYAKAGSKYLREMGFNKNFCKICEEINRYSNSNPREKESDILELVDGFCGMLLDRPERIGFKPEEALVLLEHRNLKDVYNRYLHTFIQFVNFIEKINMNKGTNVTCLQGLISLYHKTDELTKFIERVVYEFEPKIDSLITKHTDEIAEEMLNKVKESNRPLFSQETTRKIMAHIQDEEELGKERKNV